MRRIFFILILGLVALVALVFYMKCSRRVPAYFSVDFFNVGQGDAALIRFADGEKILVDCGPDRTILSKLGESLPFYDRTLDYLIVTHPDLDHYGGCLDVLKKYGVKNVITNGVRKESDHYWRIWDDYSRQHARVSVAGAGSSLMISGNKLEFLAPDGNFSAASNKEGNNESIVFRLVTSSTVFLFAGDMETPLEKCLAEKYCQVSAIGGCPKLKADILKAGHHGSDSSTGVELLEAVRPAAVVISVGKNNFGHPSLRVLRRLERARVDILRTDERGDIIME